MPSKAIETMGANLAQVTKNSPEALDGSPNELYKVAQFAGNKGAELYANRRPGAAPPQLATLSPKLVHTLVLSKVDLRWNAKQKAWHSVGKIGVAGVGKQSLNALVDGYVEIRRENSTDQVEIYIEAEPQTWYYLRYANNIVLAKSSSESFDGEIGGKAKGDPNTATEFGVFLGDYSDVDQFRAHFERDYLGKSGKLAARPAAPATSSFEGDGVDKSKKKKKKANDPFSDGEITPATDPTVEEPAKKSKKKKANDPFSDGEITAPAAEPAPKKKEKKAAEPAPDPAAESAEKQKDAAPAADPTEEPVKKKKERKKDQEAAPTDPAADPSAEPTVDPGKKSKKKKKAEEDPFGDT